MSEIHQLVVSLAQPETKTGAPPPAFLSDSRLHLHLTVHSHALILFVAASGGPNISGLDAGSDENNAVMVKKGAALKSFVYALPDVRRLRCLSFFFLYNRRIQSMIDEYNRCG